MTEIARELMIDRAAAARRRIQEQIAEQVRELGVDGTPLEHVAGLSGHEFLRRWMQPEIPPPPAIAVLFGMEWLEVSEGRVVLALDPAQWMFNPLGMIHGGVAATLLDTALGSAVHTTLPPATGYATTDLHIRYLRAMNVETGRVVATATAVHSGRRNATAEGRIEAEATGKVIATGTAGCTILRASE